MMNSITFLANKFMSEYIYDVKEDIPRRKGHIFYDLENIVCETVSTDDRIMMSYFHHCNEEALKLYRKRQLNSANLIHQKMEGANLNIYPSVNNGLKSLYYAMSAYGEYVKLDFGRAKIKIDLAIGYAIRQSFFTPRFLMGLADQWLNKIRLYLKQREIPAGQIADEMSRLFLFSYSGIIAENDLSAIIEKNEVIDRLSCIRFLVNQFLYIADSLEKQRRIDDSFYKKIFVAFKKTVEKYDSDLNLDISKTVCLIENYYQGKFIKYLEGIVHNIRSIKLSPSFIQRKILSMFLAIVNAENVDIVLTTSYSSFIEKINSELQLNYAVANSEQVAAL